MAFLRMNGIKEVLATFENKVLIPVLWFDGISVGKDATVVEIGALTGAISRYAWKTFGVTDIYAVEALPKNYEILVKKCRGSPVCTVNLALGEYDGEVSFYEYDVRSSSSLFNIDSCIKYRRDIHLDHEVRVRSVTLKTFLKEYGIKKIDLLLMNCEGCEYFLFPQITELEKDRGVVRQISVELHPMILGQRKVLRLIRLMHPLYEFRAVKRTIRGPIQAVFSRRDKPATRLPQFYHFQYGYAAVMDFLWPALRSTQSICHSIQRLAK